MHIGIYVCIYRLIKFLIDNQDHGSVKYYRMKSAKTINAINTKPIRINVNISTLTNNMQLRQ